MAEHSASAWRTALALLALGWGTLLVLTLPEWRAMAHQWWNIDTYSHILLVPPIVAWLAWLRRGELAKQAPRGWWPGLLVVLAGLAICLAGRAAGINTIAQGGAVLALAGALLAIIGLRAGLLLAFPLAYAGFLVPVGDELIPALQVITARLATGLLALSGVPLAVVDTIHIDTPAGRFNIAEECSGVKFLIAMLALGVLVAWTCFASWRKRGWFLLACVVVPILANGVRAWATICIAQSIGAEAAGSFDHVVYGWFFFGIVIAMVLGLAWRHFERLPEDAGWSSKQVAALPVMRAERLVVAPLLALGGVLAAAAGFAVAAALF